MQYREVVAGRKTLGTITCENFYVIYTVYWKLVQCLALLEVSRAQALVVRPAVQTHGSVCEHEVNRLTKT